PNIKYLGRESYKLAPICDKNRTIGYHSGLYFDSVLILQGAHKIAWISIFIHTKKCHLLEKVALSIKIESRITWRNR
ncbi:MAG: hypothetical protein R3Y56_05580, partial [Akkermansia sp.]